MEQHFMGVNETERFNNDLLNETRKTNELLEQLVQLLKKDTVQPTDIKAVPEKRRYERKVQNG